jgi:hypothetical protein
LFSDATADVEWPRPLSERALRDRFGGTGWNIMKLHPATLRRDGRRDIALWVVQAERP